MDSQSVLNLLLGAGLMVLGWLAREMWGAIKELRSDLSVMRESVPKDYVSKSDFREALGKVEMGLQRIYDKLDSKVDK